MKQYHQFRHEANYGRLESAALANVAQGRDILQIVKNNSFMVWRRGNQIAQRIMANTQRSVDKIMHAGHAEAVRVRDWFNDRARKLWHAGWTSNKQHQDLAFAQMQRSRRAATLARRAQVHTLQACKQTHAHVAQLGYDAGRRSAENMEVKAAMTQLADTAHHAQQIAEQASTPKGAAKANVEVAHGELNPLPQSNPQFIGGQQEAPSPAEREVAKEEGIVSPYDGAHGDGPGTDATAVGGAAIDQNNIIHVKTPDKNIGRDRLP